MAEIKMPVRVLQSGKVYRQMFDAEVQLIKSLEASKTRKKETSTKPGGVQLPNIIENKPEISHPEKHKSKLTAANILSERQKTWTEGMPNDSVTENPVFYRQMTTEAASKHEESEADVEAREVRGLPTIVHVTKKNSDIVQRIADRRKEKHDIALDEMYHDLGMISNRVEPRITSIGENVQQQLSDDDAKIEAELKPIMDDESLINFSHQNLQEVWTQIETHSTTRRQYIKNTNEWFNQVEDERLEAIAGVFRKNSAKLIKIASLSTPDVHRLIEKESMMINQSILANRRAYEKLNVNLMESDIQRELDQQRTWSERVTDWKKLNAEFAVQKFIEFMKSPDVVDPPGVKQVMETFLNEQKSLSVVRRQILEQMGELKPPSSTKPSVYKWNTALTKANEDIDKLHLKMVRHLHEKYETVCQTCLTEIEKYKQNLLISKVCDEDDMRRIVNDHLLPLVGNQLRSFERRLEKMDQMLEELATRTEHQFRGLFKFAQGVSHLWDVHEIGLAKQERKLQSELEQTRQLHDVDNQEREGKLDIRLDRLRQESTDEALSLCLEQCLEMLAYIKEGYEEFHSQQMDKVSEYPGMVHEELVKYDEAVCRFFNVNRDKPSEEQLMSEPDKEKPRDSSKDEEEKGEDGTELERVVREILKTETGTSFYVITVADKEDFEEEEEKYDDEDAGKNQTFMTQSQGSEDLMPEYIQNVFIETSTIRDMKKFVRMSFLNHLEQWKEVAHQNSEVTCKNKQEELVSELDLRLHLHDPRSKRIEMDVRNVRAAELVLHKERVGRHCKGITAALSSLKHNFTEMTKQHDETAAEFRGRVEKMEDVFISATKSTKLVELTNNLHNDLGCYVDGVKSSLRQFRQKLDNTLGRLRESNAQCVKSFKLFSEGGNFSPEESIPLRKRLEKMSQRVDASEGAVMRDLEGMESKRIDQATEIVNKFEDRFRNHLVDLTFIEKMQRWATNSQVRIKTEVAYSNGMAAEVMSHLSTLQRRVDACERPNIDKETVTPALLRSYEADIMECLHKRSVYLNCAKPQPQATSEVISKKLDSQSSVPHDSHTSNPTPNFNPTPSTAPRGATRGASAGSKATQKAASRMGLETQGTYSRGGRQPAEDAAIGVIKNILRAQKGKGLDLDDEKSVLTGVTPRYPPSTSNSQTGPSAKHRAFQRHNTLASITGSVAESESSRKQTSDGISSGVYRRRETKFELKYMIFGTKMPEGTHFMAKVHQILHEALDGMLSTAEIYYKQKGNRLPTRPQLIQDTFDQCAEKVVEKLSSYERQSDGFHNASLQDFRKVLLALEEELCSVPRLLLHELLDKELAVLQQGQTQLEATFLNKEKSWQDMKKSNKNELRPTLGHPDRAPVLKQLYDMECKRQTEHVEGVVKHAKSLKSNITQCASYFIEQLSSLSHELLLEFDHLLTVDDIYVGRIPARREHTSVLLRRRANGVDMNDVADPAFGIKPVVERGAKQWPGCEGGRLSLDAPYNEETTSTSSTTLPHTTVVSQRDAVLRMYEEKHTATLEKIQREEEVRLQGEQRWKMNWEDSISGVKNLYE
ncbi:coiled-coil domain-containing protein 180-like [Ciona intestinalis]